MEFQSRKTFVPHQSDRIMNSLAFTYLHKNLTNAFIIVMSTDCLTTSVLNKAFSISVLVVLRLLPVLWVGQLYRCGLVCVLTMFTHHASSCSPSEKIMFIKF